MQRWEGGSISSAEHLDPVHSPWQFGKMDGCRWPWQHPGSLAKVAVVAPVLSGRQQSTRSLWWAGSWKKWSRAKQVWVGKQDCREEEPMWGEKDWDDPLNEPWIPPRNVKQKWLAVCSSCVLLCAKASPSGWPHRRFWQAFLADIQAFAPPTCQGFTCSPIVEVFSALISCQAKPLRGQCCQHVSALTGILHLVYKIHRGINKNHIGLSQGSIFRPSEYSL